MKHLSSKKMLRKRIILLMFSYNRLDNKNLISFSTKQCKSVEFERKKTKAENFMKIIMFIYFV